MRRISTFIFLAVTAFMSACVPTGQSSEVASRSRSCSPEEMAEVQRAVDVLVGRGFVHDSVIEFTGRAAQAVGCSRGQNGELAAYIDARATTGERDGRYGGYVGSDHLGQVSFDLRTGRRIDYGSPVEAARDWPRCFADNNTSDCRVHFDPVGNLSRRDDTTTGHAQGQSCRFTEARLRQCSTPRPHDDYDRASEDCFAWTGLSPMVLPVGASAAPARISLAGAVRRAAASTAPAVPVQPAPSAQGARAQTPQVALCRELN